MKLTKKKLDALRQAAKGLREDTTSDKHKKQMNLLLSFMSQEQLQQIADEEIDLFSNAARVILSNRRNKK